MLLLFACRHYGYQHLPTEFWGDAFSAIGSLCFIALIASARIWWPIAAWICLEEALSAACSIWWMIDPWIVDDEQCSDRIGFKLSSVGLLILAIVCNKLLAIIYSSKKQCEKTQ